MKRRHRTSLSLRAKILAIIAGGAIFALVAALVLLFAVRQADHNLARASAAQRHLELLIVLSGRVSDYGLSAVEAVQLANARPELLESGRTRVAAIFQALDAVVSEQVGLVASDEARNAAATKSLIIARMKAQFEALHNRVTVLAGTGPARADGTAFARSTMDAFGVSFAPLLAQALEDERFEARKARKDMSVLRGRATGFAIVWIVSAAALAVILYIAVGRSILARIAETVRGARAISSGQLDKRLTPSGRDELTLLMARFNRMADNLSRREKRLLAAQRDLKRTIEARTADLRAANRRLEDIDTNRRRFFADISHELRTPLTVILGEAEVSLRQAGARAEAPVRKAFGTIHARSMILRRRVDDMLRVARSESGRLDLAFAAGDLNAIAGEAVKDVSPLARRLGVSVKFQRAARAASISCDKDWLRQVIAGLLINALKYSPEGAVVQAAVKSRKGKAIMTIRDQGYGIADKDLPHIFERFYRGRNRSDRQEGGYGVGLALVKWVVSEHDGEIAIKSPARDSRRAGGPANPGTVATLELPLAPRRNERESRT